MDGLPQGQVLLSKSISMSELASSIQTREEKLDWSYLTTLTRTLR